MRKLTLPLMAVCALFAISAPSAIAADSTNVKQYKQIGKVRSAVKGLKGAIRVIKNIDAGQTSTINTNQGKLDAVSGTVNTILEGVPAIVNGLTALKAGLEAAGAGLVQLKAGLVAIDAALKDPTTGLVGLNNARPQFGAFNGNGTLVDGTGAHPPARGPSGAASHLQPGKYVVDFGNDVSARALVVTMIPGPTAPIGQAVTCAFPAVVATCTALNGGTLANPENAVLVTTEDHSGTQVLRDSNGTPDASGDIVAGQITAADAAFYVAAISG